MSSNGAVLDYQEAKVPLLEEKTKQDDDIVVQDLARRVGVESKKLWQIVGPAIFSRLTSYSMLVITQAFAGHLGDLELAGIDGRKIGRIGKGHRAVPIACTRRAVGLR